MAHLVATQRYEDVYYVPPPEWLPVLSLGFDRALADLLWIRALLYFGEEIQHRGDVEHAFDYTDAVLALDPGFKRVYRWIGMASMYRPQAVTVDDIRRGIDYLERAVVRFPEDGELAWDLGASLFHELGPHLEGAEKAEVRRKGLTHMQAAARMGAGPPWLVLANANQLLELGETEQAIRHLEEMYLSVSEPELRENIAAQLSRLRSEARAEALRGTVADLEARRERDFPYVPPGLFLHLGPRPPADPAAGLRRGFTPPSPSSSVALSRDPDKARPDGSE